MIIPLTNITINDFSRDTLPAIAPYFDLDYSTSNPALRYLWFNNLLKLAQHDLSLAHCVQHHTYPRQQMKLKFGNNMPFIDLGWSQTVGCFSNYKKADTLSLNGRSLNGTKHWISLLEIADFGIFRIPAVDREPGVEAAVLIDLKKVPHQINSNFSKPIGMEIAKPASLIIKNHEIDPNDILLYKKYTEHNAQFFDLLIFSDYCFITNFLGINLGLYNQFKDYLIANDKSADETEFKRIGLEISALRMMWEDNLSSINDESPSEVFWHRRNTQYTLSKSILIKLIGFVLQSGDSRWCDSQYPDGQRFRDALTFCQHMRPLQVNLKEKNFVHL